MNSEQRTWLIIGVVAVIVLIAAFSIGSSDTTNTVTTTSSGSAEGTIKLGFMGPLTGDAAIYGESIQRGVELAFEEAGVENVEVIYEDSLCNGRDAVNAINKLISVDGVVAIVGEACSGATLAAAPVAEENGVVLISPASTSPEITTAGEYIFRTIPSDALQGAFGADLIAERGHNSLAILYGNEEYGVGFNSVLFESFDGAIVASEPFERGAVDLRAQLTKIQAANPDAIYIISNSPDSAVAALQQIEELGIDAAIFGSEGLRSDDILEVGAAAEGLIVTTVTSGTSTFMESHETFHETAPGPFAAQGYDAFTALARAIKDGATTGEEIKDALTDLEFEGASGTITFDEFGDVFGNYDVFTAQNGEWIAA